MTLSFIGAVGSRVMIHFPKKRCLSVSTTRLIQMRDRGSEKFGSLKDFEVCGILEKELLCNGQKAINSFGTAICLK
jgi:hypothetical protein